MKLFGASKKKKNLHLHWKKIGLKNVHPLPLSDFHVSVLRCDIGVRYCYTKGGIHQQPAILSSAQRRISVLFIVIGCALQHSVHRCSLYRWCCPVLHVIRRSWGRESGEIWELGNRLALWDKQVSWMLLLKLAGSAAVSNANISMAFVKFQS